MEMKLPRRESRENAFLVLFSGIFGDKPLEEILSDSMTEEHPLDDFAVSLLTQYYDHTAEVDDLIQSHLRDWTMQRLPKVTLSLLRLSITELLYGEEHKPAVTINEAVELSKKYGGENDYQFVNGLLGNIVSELGLTEDSTSAQDE